MPRSFAQHHSLLHCIVIIITGEDAPHCAMCQKCGKVFGNHTSSVGILIQIAYKDFGSLGMTAKARAICTALQSKIRHTHTKIIYCLSLSVHDETEIVPFCKFCRFSARPVVFLCAAYAEISTAEPNTLKSFQSCEELLELAIQRFLPNISQSFPFNFNFFLKKRSVD